MEIDMIKLRVCIEPGPVLLLYLDGGPELLRMPVDEIHGCSYLWSLFGARLLDHVKVAQREERERAAKIVREGAPHLSSMWGPKDRAEEIAKKIEEGES